MEWTEAGVAGAYRFVQRLYPAGRGGRASRDWADGTAGVRRRPRGRCAARRTGRIAAVTEALEGFAFNVAVARIHEFAEALAEAERGTADGGRPRLGAARGGAECWRG